MKISIYVKEYQTNKVKLILNKNYKNTNNIKK